MNIKILNKSQLFKMSDLKRRRLPKGEYEKREKSCHKNKNGLAPWHFYAGFHCSRDKKENVYCVGCKTLIIPCDTPDFGAMATKFEQMGGVVNCCYDCRFSWFCNKCCFTYIFEGKQFRTCGNTLMAILLNSRYLRGRYSDQRHGDQLILLRRFFAKEMKYGLRDNILKGQVVDIDKLRAIYSGPEPEKGAKRYRQEIKEARKKMLPFDMSISEEALQQGGFLYPEDNSFVY